MGEMMKQAKLLLRPLGSLTLTGYSRQHNGHKVWEETPLGKSKIGKTFKVALQFHFVEHEDLQHFQIKFVSEILNPPSSASEPVSNAPADYSLVVEVQNQLPRSPDNENTNTNHEKILIDLESPCSLVPIPFGRIEVFFKVRRSGTNGREPKKCRKIRDCNNRYRIQLWVINQTTTKEKFLFEWELEPQDHNYEYKSKPPPILKYLPYDPYLIPKSEANLQPRQKTFYLLDL
jgi:hypothetical protein